MANVKVTPSNITAKITQWANGTNTTDLFIYHPSDGIDEKDIITRAWQLAGLVVTITPYQDNFKKITFIEKL